ncbi:MAG: nucleotidyltransferase family protein [Cyanobacteria bacterium P01_E01_bin.35]
MSTSELNNLEATEKQTAAIAELLIICARIHFDDSARRKREALLQKEIDWQQLIETASCNGVASLLYCNLKDSSNVPPDIIHHLKKKFFDNLKKNTIQTRELNQVLESLARSQIEAIPFKGAVLAISVYGSLSLREYGDLDLLIKEADFIPAKNILIERGYRPKYTWFLNQAQEQAFLCQNGEYSLISQDGAIDIDLHTRLISGYLFTLAANLDYFWTRLQKISILGRQTDTFQLEDNLIYLCIHGTKSFWERIIWICDVAELINLHQNLDWQYLLAKSQSLGCRRMLLLGCCLARDLLSAKLPEQIAEHIDRESQLKALVNTVNQKLQGKRNYPRVDQYTLDSYWFYIRAMERWQDRWTYSWQSLITRMLAPLYKIFIPRDLDRKFIALPRHWDVLYYLVKPIRVIAQLFNSKIMNNETINSENVRE